MHFNVKQLYTLPLELHELDDLALIIDTETLGSGPTLEIIEIALGEMDGRIIYESLVKPVFNPLPVRSRHLRFNRDEFSAAPVWENIWPSVSKLINRRLLVAYNAAFDRRALAATCSRYRHVSNEKGWRCAMHLVTNIIGTSRSLTLAEACARYNLPGGSHRAATDVRATTELLRCLAASAAH